MSLAGDRLFLGWGLHWVAAAFLADHRMVNDG